MILWVRGTVKGLYDGSSVGDESFGFWVVGRMIMISCLCGCICIMQGVKERAEMFVIGMVQGGLRKKDHTIYHPASSGR